MYIYIYVKSTSHNGMGKKEEMVPGKTQLPKVGFPNSLA